MFKAIQYKIISKHSFLSGLIVFLVINGDLCAQNNIFQSGAREAGLANTAIAIADNYSMFHNPGNISGVKATTIGVNYSNVFMLPELSLSSISGLMPFRQGAFGVSASYYGSSQYNEQKYAFGYGLGLGDKISAGISIDYFRVNLPGEYESEDALAGEIGIIVTPIENLSLACVLYNPTATSYKNYPSENLPSCLYIGAAYQSEGFLITSQANIESDQDPVLSLASELYLVKNFAIRLGISTDDLYQYSFGLGYTHTKLNADIAFARHPVLGFSSFITLNYAFLQKSQ